MHIACSLEVTTWQYSISTWRFPFSLIEPQSKSDKVPVKPCGNQQI